MDSDNRGTEAAASWHLQPLMEIQCEEEEEQEEEEEEEEGLCHCWLVTASPAGSSWSWLMELSAVPRRGRAGLFSHSLKPPFICPQQMGPPGPPARLHLPCLMRSASFILISEQVPEHNHLTYRWPLWLVHLHKVTLKTTAHYSAVVRCGLQVVKTSLFCPRSAGGRHTGTMTDLVLLSCTIFRVCVWLLHFSLLFFIIYDGKWIPFGLL